MTHITSFKRILCLLLALVCVVNMTTRPVAAVASAATYAAVSVLSGLAAAYLGKALMGFSEWSQATLDNFIANVQWRWRQMGKEKDGKVEVNVDKEGNVYVSEDLIEAARDEMWDMGMVISDRKNVLFGSAGEAVNIGWGTLTSPVDVEIHAFYSAPTMRYIVISGSAFVEVIAEGDSVYGGSASPIMVNGQEYYWALCGSYYHPMWKDAPESYDIPQEWFIASLIDGTYYAQENMSVIEGFNAGYIAGRSAGLADGYTQWAQGSVEAEINGEKQTIYPVYIGADYAELGTLTQEQIWQGGVTQAELGQQLDLSLGQYLGNIKTFLKAQLQELGQRLENVQLTIQQVGQLFTTTTLIQSPLEALHFGAMFDLFPFSIPYDLVQCINFWGASAEAPTLTIPLPTVQGGRAAVTTYDVNLGELPGFNQIAALIRAGELILFGIGLVLITRKVTKW